MPEGAEADNYLWPSLGEYSAPGEQPPLSKSNNQWKNNRQRVVGSVHREPSRASALPFEAHHAPARVNIRRV